MLKQAGDRWGLGALWALLILGALDRAYLLFVFGFQYIGIDDALIQQVAIDYGNGIFREPFLYGQNYNPMLEALLAAPFVRLGAAPWIVLPIVTSFLALIPFWSCAWWSRKRGSTTAALVFAAMPLLLPVEWGMMTSMSRGFVHGIALLALVPWTQERRRPLFKHASTALVLCTALFCNPNSLPLVAGIGVWLMTQHFKSAVFWGMNILACSITAVLHFKAQAFFLDHPLVHPLTLEDVNFSFDLVWTGLRHLDDHFLHVNPFGGWAIIVILGLVVDVYTTWRLGQRAAALSLSIGVVVTMLALGILKVHEGCESVFFPKSRMFLSFPLLIAVATALYLRTTAIAKWWILPVVLLVAVGLVSEKMMHTRETVQRELARQSCAYVREEPLSEVRDRCMLLNELGERFGADVVVPIRWPGIRTDHRAHFQAHFTCYACPVLVDFVPVVGIGYDRRSWLREEFGGSAPGRILFVGGDPTAWALAMRDRPGIERIPWANEVLHVLNSDTASIERIIRELGVDDDLDR